MSESEEWPEHYFELRHARRIRKLEGRLIIPTILLHIGNIILLRETRWWRDSEPIQKSPHSPRSAVSPSSPFLQIDQDEDIDPITIVYCVYILTLAIVLICFTLARLYSPTLNKGLTEEAISTQRCRHGAGVTILTIFLVLPFLFMAYPRWAILLLVFLLYKAYAVKVLFNYCRLLKLTGNYYSGSSQINTYPTDQPISNGEDLSFFVDEEDSISRSWVDGNNPFSNIDPPPSYEEVIGSSNKFPVN